MATHPTRRDFLRTAAGGAALLALPRWSGAADAPAAVPGPARPPNIVLVLADDLGLSRVSCCGGAPFRTPQIDRLAETGLRFERAYSMPLCGPTRAALLTGKYPFRTGATTNENAVFDREAHVPFPRRLREAGYATCIAGKLGQVAREDDVEAPAALGFDEYMLWMGRGTPDRYWSPRYHRNGELVQGGPSDYGPDLTQAFLVDFMRRHRDRPFFAFYSAALPHGPYCRTPDSKGDGRLVEGMVEYFDKQVGQLEAALGELGLRGRTILVVTSDNGPAGSPLGTVGGKALVGAKNSAKEGGVREPFVVHGPGLVPAGRVCPDLTDITDLYPTVLELAGAPPPADRPVDGRSIAPQILGRAGRPREWIYAQVRDEFFIADRRHKLYGDGTFVDIADSPVAETPPAADDAAAAAARERLAAEMAELRAGAAPARPSAPDGPRRAARAARRGKGTKEQGGDAP